MLDSLPIELLPGQPPGRVRRDKDISTFRTIGAAGNFVKEGCIQYASRPNPGWNNAGAKEAQLNNSYTHVHSC